MSLLEIEGLGVAYPRSAPVLTDVSLTVRAGEILGVIGETGSGKTTLARAVVGLAPVRTGRVHFDGVDLTALAGRRLREHRRTGALQYVFQDPLRALDPQQTVGAAVGEGLRVAGVGRAEVGERVAQALDAVGLDPQLAGRLPGQVSGGQRQRVLLARALAPRPRLLLCDEPVSALDASNRNHVLRLLDELRRELGVTIVVISHDLSSLAGIADRIAVLYGGRIVELGPTGAVLGNPLHPYTALLTASAPSVRRRERRLSAASLRRDADPPAFAGSGCVFAARCPFADTSCRTPPALHPSTSDGHTAACHHSQTWRRTLVGAA